MASIAKKSFVTRLPSSVSRGHLCPWASYRRCFERGQQLKMMQQQQRQQRQWRRQWRRRRWWPPLQLLLPNLRERLRLQPRRRLRGHCHRMTIRSRTQRDTRRKAGSTPHVTRHTSHVTRHTSREAHLHDVGKRVRQRHCPPGREAVSRKRSEVNWNAVCNHKWL